MPTKKKTTNSQTTKTSTETTQIATPKKERRVTAALEREQVLQDIDDNILRPEEATRIIDSFTNEQKEAITFSLEIGARIEKARSRGLWGRVLLYLIIIGFAASYIMVFLIGIGFLHFDNSSYAVPSVVAAGIIQTYGLAKIATQYFFSDDAKDPSRKID